MKNQPFDPTQYKAYHGHCQNYYVDESLQEWQMKAAAPLFFENASKGEKRTVYRGHLIVRKRDHHRRDFGMSFDGPERTVVYVFDCRKNDFNCISTNEPLDLREAKKLIDQKLDQPAEPAFTLAIEEVTVMVPAKVQVAVFRDSKGVVGADVEKWVHVGPPDLRQQDNPGDTFCTQVWSEACNEAAKTPAKKGKK
jgi:hypothetical protein